MRYKHIYDKIEHNLENHKNGNINCIPFYGFDRLQHAVPGIEKSTYTILTGGTGTGKSTLARQLYIYSPIIYWENKKKELGEDFIKFNINLFSLEESETKVVLSEISRALYNTYNIEISTKQLMSIGLYNRLPDGVYEKIKKVEKDVEKLFNYVNVITHVSNPTGIFKTIQEDIEKNGVTTKKDIIIAGETKSVFDSFTPNHKDYYSINVIDNYQNLSDERDCKGDSERMKKMSTYAMELRDRYNATLVAIQQQSFAADAVDSKKNGFTEPSLGGLGNSKEIARDIDYCLGLYNPLRFEEKMHRNYNCELLKGKYRDFSIMKSRDGISDLHLGMLFNGAGRTFKELPKATIMINNRPEVNSELTKIYKENGNN
jgi:replicative DNA helicase